MALDDPTQPAPTRALSFPVPLEPDDIPPVEALTPDTPEPVLVSYANRLLRQLAAIEAEKASVKAAARVEVDTIVKRWEFIAETLQERADRVRTYLALLVPRLAYFGKRQRTLEAGIVGRKKVPMKVEVLDPALYEQWAQNHQMHDTLFEKRTTWHRDLDALKKYVAETGDEPEGTKIVTEHDDIVLRPDLSGIGAPPLPGDAASDAPRLEPPGEGEG